MFVLLSTNPFDWHSNNAVPETAVNGMVDGVKLLVYRPVPFTKRKLDIFPLRYLAPVYKEPSNVLVPVPWALYL